MHIVRAENLIANYFEQNPETKNVKLSKIRKIKKFIETNFRKKQMCVIVDLTRDSLINMVNISPDLFEWEKKDDSITIKNREKFNEVVTQYFNPKVERAIRNTYLQLMENFKEQA